MTHAWTLTTEPEEEPVDIDALKAHLRVTHTREDALIVGYGKAARRAAESYLRRGLMTQTWTYRLDTWAREIPLPMAWPLQSVTSVKYAHPDTGTLTTLATSVYSVDTTATPGVVRLKPGQSWPSHQTDNAQAIEIIYVVGYTEAALIDPLIVQGILMHAAHLHLDREGTSPDGDAARRAAERFWTLAGCLELTEPRVC